MHATTPPSPLSTAASLSDTELFLEAMKPVTPLNDGDTTRIPPPRPTEFFPSYATAEEAEVYRSLTDLVEGNATFDLYHTDEYVEGAVQGLPYHILRKLRRGEFSYQDHLDLHGYTRREAYHTTVAFVEAAYTHGHRCVLIVPGRGRNSTEKKSVLKESLIRWLTQHPLKHLVLAFSSARSCDGGLGAVYVLLRRLRRKGSFAVRTFSL